DALPNWSADRISSNVWPAAPFIVIPNANDALSGDTKTFVSRCAALMVFHSRNEYAFAAPTMFSSDDVSGRGSDVSTLGCGPAGAGSLALLPHPLAAMMASAVPAKIPGRTSRIVELTPAWFFLLMAQPFATIAGHLLRHRAP